MASIGGFTRLGAAPTAAGPAQVWQVRHPFPGDGPPWARSYAAVLPDQPLGLSHPVAMLITVKVAGLIPLVEGEPALHWEPFIDQVHDVYADPAIGYTETRLPTTTDIGVWMREAGLFAAHSPSRTDSGDDWAGRVGGLIPPRTGDPLDPTLIRTAGAKALERLRTEWGRWWQTG